jgi:D-serine deaminase-like pyridoxal phosphate-dependent protein
MSPFPEDFSPTRLTDLPTPALVVDATIARRNIQRMADYTAGHGLHLRPHTKTHKSKRLARLQLAAGAAGLTVAKAGEAEAMSETGADILVAYPALDPVRTRRLATLARTASVRIAVDTPTAITALGAAAVAAHAKIGLLIELDVGLGRTGVGTAAASLALAQLVSRTEGLRLDGLLCYPGHIWAPAAEQGPLLQAVSAQLDEAIALWARHGLEARIVSGGSTPTAFQSHLVKPYTEIRPGTYVFNDMNTVRGGFCALTDCAATIVCTVVSDAVRDQVVIDGGTKTFTSDLCIPARESGHGCIVEYPEAKITRLSEEHGQVDVSRCEPRPKIGERVTVIPNHICPCVNLQDALWWCEANEPPLAVPVDARGRLS